MGGAFGGNAMAKGQSRPRTPNGGGESRGGKKICFSMRVRVRSPAVRTKPYCGAHCVSYGVNAFYEKADRYGSPGISQAELDRHLGQADNLARAVGLDMVEAGCKPTIDNYLGRVPKRRILEAVREGAGQRAVQLIDHLKKGEMAKEAERLLGDSGWLPEPLRLTDGDQAAGRTIGGTSTIG